MSLPSYLSKIKSAGIYRFVFDKSEVPGQDAETMRLVVGYSEKGPFNTPVYIEKITEFETIIDLAVATLAEETASVSESSSAREIFVSNG